MNILVVDDEQLALKDMVRQLGKINLIQQDRIIPLGDSTEAWEYAQENPVDIMFLDINMPVLSGLELAKRIRKIQPQCKIIFTTGYSEYAIEAFKLKAQGYLLKPILKDELEEELKVCLQDRRQLYIQCFGNFAVFYQGQPVHFRREKAKELLAYLVDRKGAFVSQPELVAVLWEDQPDTPSIRSLLRTLVSSLRQTFKELGCEEILITSRNEMAINKGMFSCDYYDYLARNNKEVGSEELSDYMRNYSWR